MRMGLAAFLRLARQARYQAEALAVIAPPMYRFPPAAILDVPADRLGETLREIASARPTELAFDFRGIHGIASIMPRPICDEADEFAVKLA
jgi:hypothetical protein